MAGNSVIGKSGTGLGCRYRGPIGSTGEAMPRAMVVTLTPAVPLPERKSGLSMTCELVEKSAPVTVMAWPFVLTLAFVGVTPEIVGGPERTLNTRELLVAVPTGDGNLSSSPGTEQVGGNVRRHSAVGDHTRGKSSRGGARFAFHWTAVAPVRPPPFTVKTRAVVAGASVEIGESELTRGPVNGKGLGRRF